MAAQGVYLFFEPGELRLDGVTSRVVRAGTHALIENSTTTLWDRLSQHRGHVQGGNPGGGNHRGTIFRHHVGTVLLNTGDWPASLHESWRQQRVDRSARLDEAILERAVSGYIDQPHRALTGWTSGGPREVKKIVMGVCGRAGSKIALSLGPTEDRSIRLDQS